MAENAGKLFVIATPIGNVSDITMRAVDCLRQLQVFFCEDTRELKKLLALLGISIAGKSLHSYAKHNLKSANAHAIEFLKKGMDVGLVSDRGTPCLSDPGTQLVHEARQNGITVTAVPGPSSPIAALSISGMEIPSCLFVGFLPAETQEREKIWKWAQEIPICFFETAVRIRQTLQEVKHHFSDGWVFVARELTKQFEDCRLTQLSSLDPLSVMEKGEFVVVFEGKKEVSEHSIIDQVVGLRTCSDKEWSRQVAELYQLSARDCYNALMRYKQGLVAGGRGPLKG